MRLGTIQGLAATAIVGGALFHSLAASPSLGDEPRGIGRLFRIGGSPPPAVPPGSRSSSSSKATEPAPATANRDLSGYYGQPALTTPPSTLPGASSGPRVTPKPRVNKPATEADPVVTRVSLGRSDDGSQFAMFLQVYADGTVIDSSGVHKLGPQAGRRGGRLGRPRQGQGPLRRPGRRLHRERPRRRLRPGLWQAPRQLVLLLGHDPGLRPRRPPPPDRPGEPASQDQPRQSRLGHDRPDRERRPGHRLADHSAPAADDPALMMPSQIAGFQISGKDSVSPYSRKSGIPQSAIAPLYPRARRGASGRPGLASL